VLNIASFSKSDNQAVITLNILAFIEIKKFTPVLNFFP
jgi:hypothetical protein